MLMNWQNVDAAYASTVLLLPTQLWVPVSISVLPSGKQIGGLKPWQESLSGT